MLKMRCLLSLWSKNLLIISLFETLAEWTVLIKQKMCKILVLALKSNLEVNDYQLVVASVATWNSELHH